MVKQYINTKYKIELSEGSQLMETFGKNNLLLACIDSEDPEYIMPHSYNPIFCSVLKDPEFPHY